MFDGSRKRLVIDDYVFIFLLYFFFEFIEVLLIFMLTEIFMLSILDIIFIAIIKNVPYLLHSLVT